MSQIFSDIYMRRSVSLKKICAKKKVSAFIQVLNVCFCWTASNVSLGIRVWIVTRIFERLKWHSRWLYTFANLMFYLQTMQYACLTILNPISLRKMWLCKNRPLLFKVMLKVGYIAYPRKNMKLLIGRGTSSSTPEPEGEKSIPMQDYNRAHRQELSPHWPASHLMKWGCWRCPTELSVAGGKLMKENHSCHRKKKKKSPQANYCMEYGTFYILKRPLCLGERYGWTGNGGLRNGGDTEYTLRYSINISFIFLFFYCSHTHTHARGPTQVPRWVVDKEKGTVTSRHRQSWMYILKICTFLIIKLCHLNEQTPAKVLY